MEPSSVAQSKIHIGLPRCNPKRRITKRCTTRKYNLQTDLSFAIKSTGANLMQYLHLKFVTCVAIAVLLAGRLVAQEKKATDATASSESSQTTDTTKPVIAVFRLSGSLTETPTD